MEISIESVLIIDAVEFQVKFYKNLREIKRSEDKLIENHEAIKKCQKAR
jgi:hypothetical protein